MNVVYLFFNRPDKTRSSFARIREVKPERLYLVADGPRLTYQRTFRDVLKRANWSSILIGRAKCFETLQTRIWGAAAAFPLGLRTPLRILIGR